MLYTIGHSNHPIERFLALLRRHRIECLADVRSNPYSRYNPQFKKHALQHSLTEEGIEYRFMGHALGARRDEPAARDDAGRVDYRRVMALPAFQQGLETLLELADDRRTAIMCAEAEPLDCHRLVLVVRALRARQPEISHILRDGSLESQAAVERRLVERMGVQPDLLAGDDPDAQAERAYRLRARAMTGR